MSKDAGAFASLAASIDGEVVRPGSPGYSEATRGFNARWDRVTPRAVVRPRTAEDVAETLAHARHHRLEVALRSGGHSFAGHSTTTGIVVDVSPMRTIAVADGLARIGAGARLGDVYRGLLAHGLTIPGGSCPSVGIAGLTLGGGLGMLGRVNGITSDSLVAARVVLADGRIVDTDAEHDADLFWALRGAGSGQFGVVTELAFRPLPVPRTTIFELTWAFADAAAVVRAWQAWLVDAPHEIAPSLVIGASADTDQSPSVEVFGTLQGSTADTAALLEGLTSRLTAGPASSRVEETTYEQALRHWAGRAGSSLDDPRAQPAERSYLATRSEFFARDLPGAALDRLLDDLVGDRRAGQSRELDFTPWGGAYGRVPAAATAFVHRDARYLLKHAATIGADTAGTDKAAAHGWVDGSWRTVHDWGTGGVFPSFAEPGLDPLDHAYVGRNRDRLLAIKSRYDPDGLFRFGSSVVA